ncbi:MAG TPA: hypothetical protein VJI33_03555 [Candidatus Paceibacterota bacterium]
MNHDIEQGVIQNKPEEMQKLLKGYIETYVRDFQCLSLLAQKHGVAEVEKLRSEFKSLPFIEKMRCMGNRAFLVPGTPARKICNFLLIESLGIFDTALGLSGAEQRNEWLDALTDCGFGGSVMTSAYNRGSIWNIAQTGELDVILLDDNDGFSSKVGYMCNLRDELVKLGMKSVQCFSHGPYSNSIGSPEIRLRKFADEFFPLNQERQ